MLGTSGGTFRGGGRERGSLSRASIHETPSPYTDIESLTTAAPSDPCTGDDSSAAGELFTHHFAEFARVQLHTASRA